MQANMRELCPEIEIAYPSADLLLRAIVEITNSKLGCGVCRIPTLLLPSYGSEYSEAAKWNQYHLEKDHRDIKKLEDLYRKLGLSRKITTPYRASILTAGPSSNSFEGIAIFHGKEREMTAADNKPTMAGVEEFMTGMMECYPHLVCTSFFTNSIDMAINRRIRS